MGRLVLGAGCPQFELPRVVGSALPSPGVMKGEHPCSPHPTPPESRHCGLTSQDLLSPQQSHPAEGGVSSQCGVPAWCGGSIPTGGSQHEGVPGLWRGGSHPGMGVPVQHGRGLSLAWGSQPRMRVLAQHLGEGPSAAWRSCAHWRGRSHPGGGIPILAGWGSQSSMGVTAQRGGS